jgi:hypothetical protein
MLVRAAYAVRWSALATSGLIAGLMACPIICSSSAQSVAASVTWPVFGPQRMLPNLEGLTDTVPDFVGPLDGSAELTIFTEGNHYPVLLPLALDAFPAWCARTGFCRVDSGKILIVTLPQSIVVDILLKGGIRLGNAVVPVGHGEHVFPDVVMGGAEPLRRLASAGIVDDRATVFARHRGLGLLLRRDLAGIEDVEALRARAARIVLASESGPGARNQYRMTLDALVGTDATSELMSHEVRTFPGRLGIQHRDVPYALLNDIADGGLIFNHLAAFYTRTYPDRLRSVAVTGAEQFGQELLLVRTVREPRPLTIAFERFFLEAARTAYPEGGFAGAATFQYGAEANLMSK